MFSIFRKSTRLLRPILFTRNYATESVTLKPSNFGQPVSQTHPHLVRPNELTPGIPAEEYESRRKKLMDGLPENSVVVSVSGTVKFMSGQIFYDFRQASDFWYLTGFQEPDSAAILEKDSSSRGYRMTLFSAGKDLSKEQWDGARTSFPDACMLFRADDARSIDDFSCHLDAILKRYSHVFLDIPSKKTRRGPKSISKSLIESLTGSPYGITETVIETVKRKLTKPLTPHIARLRAIKSENEQRVMREAGNISGRAHAKTMRFTRPGLSESAVAAHFQYLCLLSGAQRLAYVPVLASGPNSLIIHYTSNNHLIQPDELVLIDAGCEYNGYASDISKTYPASGTFTPPQRDLYAAVLSVQKALVAQCTESANVTLYDLHAQSYRLLRQELIQLGFQLGAGDLERLYPHFLSHPIGIDLHESNNFNRSETLKTGMVITIEPGIYVPPSPAFPKHFHNIGIRIEDEVLVGDKHPIVLSVSAPKEISDVESACQGLLGLEPF
ncbi:peptidase M24 [Marasmius fiardii PR-910]|nr:peptidase M24 [Marasmius fiardii PR-910]